MRNTLVAMSLFLIAATAFMLPSLAGLALGNMNSSRSSLPSMAERTGSDQFSPPASSNVLIYGQIPNMTATVQLSGSVRVQFFSECGVSVTIGGYGVLLWVRLTVDGVPTGSPSPASYPGVHELCGLTAGSYVVSEGYRETTWTVNGLSNGPHTFAIDSTLMGFSNGIPTGPGPGTSGVLGSRTMIVGS